MARKNPAGRGVAPVDETELSRHPEKVTQIRWGLQGDGANTLERDPVVLAIDHGLANRPQARVRVGDPLESLPVNGARYCLGLLQRFSTECLRFAILPLGLCRQCLQEQSHPRERLAQHHRCPGSGEDVASKQFAVDSRAVEMDQRERARVELGKSLELVAGPFPVPQHAEELKEKHAQLRVRGLLPNPRLQRGNCGLWLAFPQELLGP